MTATSPNFLKLLAPLAAFACVFIVLVSFGPSGDVELPQSGAGVAAEIPPGASTDQRIEILQRSASADAASAGTFAALGDAYLQKTRETGDPSYYSRADRSFDAALRRDARNADAVLGAGTLAGLRHDFREQLRLGLEARRLVPALTAPNAVIADAQIELGRYGDAERTLQRMLDSKPNLTAYSRVSYYRELTGDLEGAVQSMRLAVSAGAAVSENVAYVQTLLGDLELQRGRPAEARSAYRAALARLPGYAPAEVGLARVQNAAGDLDAAARRLRSVSARLPLTSHLMLLADTDAARGARAAAARDLDVVRTQQQLLRAAGARPDAELILFEATHGDPAAAVRLGRRLWAQAPSVRSADALGWALTRAGRSAEGLAWAQRALRLGSRDPLFHYHAGLAAKATGRPALAARELGTALSAGAALSPLQAEQARTALEVLR
ncbi:MAG TPA: tetratricopeptide repeat protein [Thermoleophilaceae bacterium]|jgi:tetratricopeptide (TPR) repeat protein|nr:tetratricopeptide repeat protein [Thermoleophilaceae bacterium]